MRYIDWVVSSETLPEIIESNGVLTPDLLCEFDYGILDENGNFITRAQYNLQTKLQDLIDELDGVKSDIAKVEYAIRNPDKASIDLSSVALGAGAGLIGGAALGLGAAVVGGYSLAAAGVGALSYAATGAVFGPIGLAAGLVIGGLVALFGSNNSKNEQQRAINQFVENLKGELAKLNVKKSELETKIENLKKDITIAGSSETNPIGSNKIDLTK